MIKVIQGSRRGHSEVTRSILSWLSNNSLFLFNQQLIDVLSTEPCLFFSRHCCVRFRSGFEGFRDGT